MKERGGHQQRTEELLSSGEQLLLSQMGGESPSPPSLRTSSASSPLSNSSGRLSGLLKKVIRRGGTAAAQEEEEEEEGEEGEGISIVKTRVKSSFGVPLSTVAKRRNSPSSASIPQSNRRSPAPAAGIAPSVIPNGLGLDAGAFIVRRQEPSSFPGFNISTMARASKATPSRKSAVSVFQPEEEISPTSHSTHGGEEAVPEEPLLDLSEEDTLAMIAPVAVGRIKVAHRTERLDLAGYLLGFVPSSIASVEKLAVLNLAGNALSNLGTPSVLAKLGHLLEVDLSFNALSVLGHLSALDQACFALPPSLTNLCLRDCELESAPAPWVLEQVPNLSGLDIRFNRVTSLANLQVCKLTELLASYNEIFQVDGEVFKRSAATLKCVNLSHNKIRTVSVSAFESCPMMELVDLSYNRLVSLKLVTKLEHLTQLDLSCNMISVLGPEFGSLKLLRSLRARSNRIDKITFSFADLGELRLLDLSFNRISHVPDDLSSASNLRTVVLSSNSLHSISNVEWLFLTHLSVLICSGNELTDVPKSLLSHPKLEVLYLGYNRLTDLRSFVACAELKILNLSGNTELGLPKGVSNEGHFEIVSMLGNPKLLQLLLASTKVTMADLAVVISEFGPSLTVDTSWAPRQIHGIGCADMIGLRPNMEDRTVAFDLAEDVFVVAIFDGHGGDQGASLCQKRLPQLMMSLWGTAEPKQVFEQVFEHLDAEIQRTCFGGATCVVAVFERAQVHVANVGDARAVIIRSNGVVKRLSVDHRVTDLVESRRIRDGGGVILNGRLEGVIEVTRALGDAGIPLCICTPHVTSVAFQHGDVVVLGCDGIFDEMEESMVAGVVQRYGADELQIMAQMIRDQAFYLGATDNLSVACVALEPLQ